MAESKIFPSLDILRLFKIHKFWELGNGDHQGAIFLPTTESKGMSPSG